LTRVRRFLTRGVFFRRLRSYCVHHRSIIV
jgi:hypothetical protein